MYSTTYISRTISQLHQKNSTNLALRQMAAFLVDVGVNKLSVRKIMEKTRKVTEISPIVCASRCCYRISRNFQRVKDFFIVDFYCKYPEIIACEIFSYP